jgi:hypothetical protein
MPDEPLHTTTFTLTRDDALAYEQAAARLGPLGTLALVGWLGLCGASAWLIPRDWAGLRLSWSFGLLVMLLVSIGCVLALLLMAILQWRQARRRRKRPVELQLVEWPERLELSGSGLPRTVPLDQIRRTLLTRTHMFLDTDGEAIILPRRAFPEEGNVEELSQRIAAATKPVVPPPVDPPGPSA